MAQQHRLPITGDQMSDNSDATLLLDANVVIDYQVTDIDILQLVTHHLGPAIVPTDVIQDEVDNLSFERCRQLGIQCIDATASQTGWHPARPATQRQSAAPNAATAKHCRNRAVCVIASPWSILKK